MKKSLTRIFLVMLLGSFVLHIPADGAKTANEARIPFKLLDYLIVVPCRINDADETYDFIVDTGAVTFIDKALADELKLKQLGPQAKINTLRLGEHVIERVFVFTNFDLKIFRTSYGMNVHGIIGSDLLEDYIVTIDYEKRQLVLSTDLEAPALAKKSNPQGYSMKFTRHPVNHAPMIRCQLNGGMEMEAMVDSGQPYSLVLPLKDLERTGVLKRPDTRKAKGVIVEWPDTTPTDNFLAQATHFETNGLKIKDMLTVFAELPALLSVPLLGGDFLSRHLVTIDYLHGELLLFPKADFSGLDHSFSTGLVLREDSEGLLTIRGIWEKSPADRAGIQIGDRVLGFNSLKLAPGLHQELWLILNDARITSVKLLIETKKGPRKFRLKKENLI